MQFPFFVTDNFNQCFGNTGEICERAQLCGCWYHGPRSPKVPAGSSIVTAEFVLPPSLSISWSLAVLETETGEEGGRICQDKSANHERINWFKLYKLS